MGDDHGAAVAVVDAAAVAHVVQLVAHLWQRGAQAGWVWTVSSQRQWPAAVRRRRCGGSQPAAARPPHSAANDYQATHQIVDMALVLKRAVAAARTVSVARQV